jgi:hypothetical protein
MFEQKIEKSEFLHLNIRSAGQDLPPWTNSSVYRVAGGGKTCWHKMALPKTNKLLDEMIRDLEKSLGIPFSKDASGKGQVSTKSEAAPAEKKKAEASKQASTHGFPCSPFLLTISFAECREEERSRT